MPNVPGSTYVRRPYRNRTPRTRTNNPAVKRVYKKKSGAKASTKNKAAVMTLSKQVRALQQRTHGQKQWNSQWLRLSSNTAGQFPLLDNPVYWLCNSMYTAVSGTPQQDQGTQVFRGGFTTTGVPTGLPIAGASGGWAKQQFDTSYGAEWQWVPAASQSTISNVSYLPLVSSYKITIAGMLSSNQDPVKFRFTVFRLRKQRAGLGPGISMGLPEYGGAYSRLISKDVRSVNEFSRVRHHVIYDKVVTFNPPATAGLATYPGVNSEKVIRYTRRHPNKEIKLNLQPQPPPSPGGTINQNMISNLPETELEWFMISCSHSAFPNSSFTINMSRQCTWRDAHGTTTL